MEQKLAKLEETIGYQFRNVSLMQTGDDTQLVYQ